LPPTAPPPPLRLASSVLRTLLPIAEREEVLGDLREEHERRRAARGRALAAVWLWRQVLGSAPALLRRSWWRGRTGLEQAANRWLPGGFGMESWIMDLRYAVRRLRSRPTYTLLAVLTLALGVGGSAAIFSILRGLLLDPLPFAKEAEIVVFWNTFDWSEAEMLYLRPNFPGFRRVAAYTSRDVPLESNGGPTRLVPGISASYELFDVLGARPALGRGFQAGDDRQGADPVAVLSHGLWQEMGGDASILGRRVRLDGIPRTVVGVMPRGFWFPNPTVRVWLPRPLDPTNQSGNYTLIGRLAPGQSLEALPLGVWAERAVLDWTLFGAAIALAILAALGVALIPALTLWRGDLREALTRVRTATAGGRGSRIEGGLVVAEVALAVLLAAGAGLLIRSVVNLYGIDPGVDIRGVAVLDLVTGAGMKTTERQQMMRTLLDELGRLPGVRSAALTSKLPLRGNGDSWGITIEGRPDLPDTTTFVRFVSRDYFRALGIALRAGRIFTTGDRPDSEPVVVINQALAKKYFQGSDPMGRRLKTVSNRWERVVGVVEDVA